jgi:hypothetical protein
MGKSIKFVVLFLIAIPIFLHLEWIVGGYPWVKNQMEVDVRNHLAARGNQPDEIDSIEVLYNRKLGDYGAKVIFSDEQKNIYYYAYINQTIRQLGVTTSDYENAKHRENKQ